jgi:hypothetical protein
MRVMRSCSVRRRLANVLVIVCCTPASSSSTGKPEKMCEVIKVLL